MKTNNFLGNLVLGLIVGGGIGYMLATDPKKRRKINRFFNDVNDKVTDLGEKIKSTVGNRCGCEEDLSEDEITEIETILNSEVNEH